jgi:hypothetical protein
MLPKLKKLLIQDDFTAWHLNDGKIGTGFDLQHCDHESEDGQTYANKISSIIRNLDPNLILKFELTSSIESKTNFHTARNEAISKLGLRKNSVRIYVSVPPPLLTQRLRSLNLKASKILL